MSKELLKVILENMIGEIKDNYEDCDENLLLIVLESKLCINYQYLDDELMNELIEVVREIERENH